MGRGDDVVESLVPGHERVGQPSTTGDQQILIKINIFALSVLIFFFMHRFFANHLINNFKSRITKGGSFLGGIKTEIKLLVDILETS